MIVILDQYLMDVLFLYTFFWEMDKTGFLIIPYLILGNFYVKLSR